MFIALPSDCWVPCRIRQGCYHCRDLWSDLIILPKLEVVLVRAKTAICGCQLLFEAWSNFIQLDGPAGQIVPAWYNRHQHGAHSVNASSPVNTWELPIYRRGICRGLPGWVRRGWSLLPQQHLRLVCQLNKHCLVPLAVEQRLGQLLAVCCFQVPAHLFWYRNDTSASISLLAASFPHPVSPHHHAPLQTEASNCQHYFKKVMPIA